jgi:hypothetical protein
VRNCEEHHLYALSLLLILWPNVTSIKIYLWNNLRCSLYQERTRTYLESAKETTSQPMIMSVTTVKDKTTVALTQYPRSLSKARVGSNVMSETPSIPLLDKYRKPSLMLSLSLICCLRVSKAARKKAWTMVS